MIADDGETSLRPDLPDRLADVIERYGKRVAKVALLEFKLINVTDCPPSYGRWSFYTLTVTGEQRKCAALIVGSVESPLWAAVIPQYYLQKPGTGEYHVYPPAMANINRPFEPFPMRWSPFVMPITYLHRALASLDAFSRDNDCTW